MATSIEDLVLPAKADVSHLPKKNDITPNFLLLEQRKANNAVLDILEVVVREIREIKQQGNGNSTLLTRIEERIIPEVKQSMKAKMDNLVKSTSDLQGHGFRLNLICKGKGEVVSDHDETPQESEQQFKDVLKDELDIDDADSIMFRAVHRLPAPKKGPGANQPRPLIAAFLRQCDRDLVLSKSHLLKDSGISLQSHLPKKLNDLRNDMLKERRRLLNGDNSRKIRVVDKNFSPVLQEKLPNSTTWNTLKFPLVNDGVGQDGNNGSRRRSRRNTVQLDAD